MNATAHGKNLTRLLLIGCLLGTAPFGKAVNYTNTDLLLIFRENNFNDVEFDVGPVSAYLGLAQGTQKTINFDTALVKANFNDSLTGVTFSLVAATDLGAAQPRVWLTDVYTSPVPTDITLSKFSQIRSKLSSIGQQASILTQSNSLPAVIAASQSGSFTYIASDANLTPASSLGGLTGFPIEAVNPATLNFYELQISTATPKPPATLVGTLTLDGTGVLTFNAGGGPVLTAPTISGIVRNGNTAIVSFTSVTGLKYQLRYATSLPGTFNPAGTAITGDGNVQTFSDSSSDPVRFYDIQANH